MRSVGYSLLFRTTRPDLIRAASRDAMFNYSIDRFSDVAGMLFRRSADPALPGANHSINMDQPPFVTHGLGPAGQRVRYYNFDVMPVDPAPIYVLFRDGETQPVAGQQGTSST